MSGPLHTFTLKAGADLSGKQYIIGRISAAGEVNQASLATDSDMVGVQQNKPDTATGAAVTVGDLGISWIIAGAAVTAGAVMTTDSSGRAITVASGQIAIGRAIDTAGAAGDQIRAQLFPPVRWAGAA